VSDIITSNLDIWTAALLDKLAAGRGNNGKQEAYGIKKLRDLILELAVRGKLVPQDPRDEPASVLLKRIAKAKEKFFTERKIGKEKPLPEIAEEEEDYELPEGWAFVRLGDVAFSQAGFAFESRFFNESGEGIPLIRIRDVGRDFSGTYYTGEYREEFLVENGDYLISMDGDFRVSPWKNGPALLNQRVSRLIFFDESVGKRFIADSLQARLHELQGVKAYTTVDHLSGTQITESVIGLPPLAEQHRIVAKVDDLLAVCDQLEQRQTHGIQTHQTLVETLLGTLTRAASHEDLTEAWACIAHNIGTIFTTLHSIDQLKQAILQLAVTGRLVPLNADVESAEAFYKRKLSLPTGYVRSSKQAIKGASPIALERLPAIPKSWAYRSVDELYQTNHILDYADGNHGSLYPRKEDFGPDGVLFLTAAQIGDDGSIAWADCPRLAPEKAKQLKKGWSKEGDVYFTHNATVGRTAIATSCPEKEFLLGTSVTFYRLNKDSIDPKYLYLFMSSPSWYSQAAAVMQQTTRDQVSITKQALFFVALPPLPEQKRIVEVVDRLRPLLVQLGRAIKAAQASQLQLADAIVEQAVG